MKTEGLTQEQILDQIADFHGHLGPFVILGFRAGKLALRTLGAKEYFGLEAVVRCGSKPPLSCFADGVQAGSGCTTGKGNLVVDPEAAEPAVTFRTRPATGPVPSGGGSAGAGAPKPAGAVETRSLTVWVRKEIAARTAEMLRELGDRGSALRLLDLDDEELFETGA